MSNTSTATETAKSATNPTVKTAKQSSMEKSRTTRKQLKKLVEDAAARERTRARVESAPDVTGKSKSVQRFRVGRDDDDAENEEDADDRHESRRDRSSRKVPKAYDRGRERSRSRGASGSRRKMRPRSD